MKHRLVAACCALMLSHAAVEAQPSEQRRHGGHDSHRPGAQLYAGLDQREIKALSEEDIAGLRQGRGLLLALPAELNGYPGPLHVLEAADELGLSQPARHHVKARYDAMKAEATPAGEALIEAERALDRLFRDRTATAQTVDAAARQAGLLRSALRAVHLRYHLEMRAMLSEEQLRIYQRERGYAPG